MSRPADQCADWTGMIDHETVIVLAELIETLSGVGKPAPVVQRIGAWCRAEPEINDLVVEMSSRTMNPDRVGLWLKREARRVCRHEIDDVDHPGCADPDCAERHAEEASLYGFVWILVQGEPRRMCRWHNARFVRIPRDQRQLDQATGREWRAGIWHPGGGIDRSGLVALLADSGIDIKP